MLCQCPHCNARGEVDVVAAVVARFRDIEVTEAGDLYELSYMTHFDGDPPRDPTPAWRYRLLQCRSCGDPMLVRQYDFEEGDLAQRLWPPDRYPLVGFPPTVAKAIGEAIRCKESRSYLGTATMCRRALEMLCREFCPDIPKLAWALTRLRNDGIIDSQIAEWAQELRTSGNLAAHEPTADLSEEDAADLLDFTHAIMTYVYVLGQRFRLFRTRREGATER
jgi:hypothetical protein